MLTSTLTCAGTSEKANWKSSQKEESSIETPGRRSRPLPREDPLLWERCVTLSKPGPCVRGDRSRGWGLRKRRKSRQGEEKRPPPGCNGEGEEARSASPTDAHNITVHSGCYSHVTARLKFEPRESHPSRPGGKQTTHCEFPSGEKVPVSTHPSQTGRCYSVKL